MSHPTSASSTLKHDLTVLSGRAHCVLEWAEPVVVQFHQVKKSFKGEDGGRLQKLYDSIMAPLTLWPLEVCDLTAASLADWQTHAALSEKQRLVVDLLPEPPDAAACEIVALKFSWHPDSPSGRFHAWTRSSMKPVLSVKNNSP